MSLWRVYNKTVVFVNSQRYYPIGTISHKKALFLSAKLDTPFRRQGHYFRKNFFEFAFGAMGRLSLPRRGDFISDHDFEDCDRQSYISIVTNNDGQKRKKRQATQSAPLLMGVSDLPSLLFPIFENVIKCNI